MCARGIKLENSVRLAQRGKKCGLHSLEGDVLYIYSSIKFAVWVFVLPYMNHAPMPAVSLSVRPLPFRKHSFFLQSKARASFYVSFLNKYVCGELAFLVGCN